MALSKELVKHMTEPELKLLVNQFGKKNSKEKKLLCLTIDNPDAEKNDNMMELYGSLKKHGYDDLQKRLTATIENFLIQDINTDVYGPVGPVIGAILLANKMSIRKASKLMRHYCLKAEYLALQHRMYPILENIYSFQVQHILWLDLDLEEVLEKKRKNKILADQLRKMDEAISTMQFETLRIKQRGEDLDPETVIQHTLSQFELSKEEIDNPAFQLRIMTVFRSAMLFTKDYFKLESLLVSKYEELEKAGSFVKGDNEIRLAFIYMISHAYYRNRKFPAVFTNLANMKSYLPGGQGEISLYHLKYHSLNAAALAYSGKNTEAIEILENIITRKPREHRMSEWYNIELATAVYHFHAADYKKVKQIISRLWQMDPDMEEWMGKEWCFKRDLIGVIAWFDYGDIDFALALIGKLNKTYGEFLKLSKNANAESFVNYIGKVIQNPDIIKDADFRASVKMSALTWENQQDDLQAMAFFMWLKSKILKCDYYELLVAEMNGVGDAAFRK